MTDPPPSLLRQATHSLQRGSVHCMQARPGTSGQDGVDNRHRLVAPRPQALHAVSPACQQAQQPKPPAALACLQTPPITPVPYGHDVQLPERSHSRHPLDSGLLVLRSWGAKGMGPYRDGSLRNYNMQVVAAACSLTTVYHTAWGGDHPACSTTGPCRTPAPTRTMCGSAHRLPDTPASPACRQCSLAGQRTSRGRRTGTCRAWARTCRGQTEGSAW